MSQLALATRSAIRTVRFISHFLKKTQRVLPGQPHLASQKHGSFGIVGICWLERLACCHMLLHVVTCCYRCAWMFPESKLTEALWHVLSASAHRSQFFGRPSYEEIPKGSCWGIVGVNFQTCHAFSVEERNGKEWKGAHGPDQFESPSRSSSSSFSTSSPGNRMSKRWQIGTSTVVSGWQGPHGPAKQHEPSSHHRCTRQQTKAQDLSKNFCIFQLALFYVCSLWLCLSSDWPG